MLTRKRAIRACRRLLALLPVAALQLACGSDIGEEWGTSSQELTGGVRDRGDPNVVLLFSWESSNPVGTLHTCTAEVVAPNVLLTAAHCLHSGQNYAAYLGDDGNDLGTPIDLGKANVRSQLHMAKEVHAHPQYVTTQGYYDVGVVILQNNLTGVTPLAINRMPPSASLLGDVSIVGYGKTYDRDSTFAVTKYRADGLSARLDATDTMTVGDSVRHACVGDSGGPVLAEINGTATIIGTDSYSDETGDATRCRIASHYQRVDRYLSFLDQYVPRVGTQDAGADSGPGGTGGTAGDAGPDGSAGHADAGNDAGVDSGWVYDTGVGSDSGGSGGIGTTAQDAGGMYNDAATDAGDAAAGPTGWGATDDMGSDDGCTVSRHPLKSSSGVLVFAALSACLAWRRGSRRGNLSARA